MGAPQTAVAPERDRNSCCRLSAGSRSAGRRRSLSRSRAELHSSGRVAQQPPAVAGRHYPPHRRRVLQKGYAKLLQRRKPGRLFRKLRASLSGRRAARRQTAATTILTAENPGVTTSLVTATSSDCHCSLLLAYHLSTKGDKQLDGFTFAICLFVRDTLSVLLIKCNYTDIINPNYFISIP